MNTSGDTLKCLFLPPPKLRTFGPSAPITNRESRERN